MEINNFFKKEKSKRKLTKEEKQFILEYNKKLNEYRKQEMLLDSIKKQNEKDDAFIKNLMESGYSYEVAMDILNRNKKLEEDRKLELENRRLKQKSFKN